MRVVQSIIAGVAVGVVAYWTLMQLDKPTKEMSGK
jgi:hypothetical protein